MGNEDFEKRYIKEKEEVFILSSFLIAKNIKNILIYFILEVGYFRSG